jgi:hypothetical protein
MKNKKDNIYGEESALKLILWLEEVRQTIKDIRCPSGTLTNRKTH